MLLSRDSAFFWGKKYAFGERQGRKQLHYGNFQSVEGVHWQYDDKSTGILLTVTYDTGMSSTDGGPCTRDFLQASKDKHGGKMKRRHGGQVVVSK